MDRTAQTLSLDEPVSRLGKAATGRRLAGLARLEINTLRDLLCHYPTRYNDFSHITPIRSLVMGEKQSVLGIVDEVRVKRPRPRLSVVEVSILDESGVLFASWFNQPWMSKNLTKGSRLLLLGKAEHSYGHWRMASPLVTTLPDDEEAGGIHPVYRANSDISTEQLCRLAKAALALLPAPLDPLPAALRQRYNLVSRQVALRDIHLPPDDASRRAAHRRLAFEEVYLLQLFLMLRRMREATAVQPFEHTTAGPTQAALAAALPFTLTPDQQSALAEIRADMSAAHCMDRLLLGDVGSGKTIVAAFALACAHDSGTQAAMMAPTEVLAEQYARVLGPLFDALGLPWALLTSSTGAAERGRLLEALACGSVSVLFGTHALIEPDVRFARLSLAVIDEQHRFGVEQRAALRAKGAGCDVLSMSATPIPRSLALTLYGDRECSFIRSRPQATTRTSTRIVPRAGVHLAYEAIREALARGEQAYIICPLIGEAPEAPDAPEVPDANGAFGAANGKGRAKGGEGTEGAPKRGGGSDQAGAEDAVSLTETGEGGAYANDELPADLITEFSAELDEGHIQAAQAEVAFLRAKVFPEEDIGLMTSRLRPAEKRTVMEDFRAGELAIMVSTTVVEVGVDVPNATVMVVMDADRFGLSQLHQLRGRVGRGTKDAQVFLVTGSMNEVSRRRLEVMERTSDGFELAEYDLRLRREGDILGNRQHGLGQLKLVNVVRDAPLIQAAHRAARELLVADPLLQDDAHRLLAWELGQVFSA